MLFPTIDFALFFALVFLGHWLLNPKPLPWKLFMIGASYVFYAWWDVRVHLAARGRVGDRASSARSPWPARPTSGRRRVAMVAGVALTLAPLAVLQVLRVLRRSSSRTRSSSLGLNLGLPLVAARSCRSGISFFTFMAISYIVDVYRGRHDASRAGSTSFLYLSFFPHLVAGPIVRPNELIPQLDVRRDPRHIDVAGASWLILGGLFKKVVVSSFLADHDRRPGVRRPGGALARSSVLRRSSRTRS